MADEGLVHVAIDSIALDGNLLVPSAGDDGVDRLRACGGDLAGPALVEAPTLLIVGGDDVPVIAMNRQAMAQMHCERRMEIVPGATHLFEEPGTLEKVAELAREWFARYLR
jgi:putative phosphoribosyl transferase